MAKLAFLGLGVMGAPMAGHLKLAGHDVTVFNRTAAKAEAWVARHGGARAETPRQAAQHDAERRRALALAVARVDEHERVGAPAALGARGVGQARISRITRPCTSVSRRRMPL